MQVSWGVAAPALMGNIPRSVIATPIVRKWTVWTEKYLWMDWGSLIPLVCNKDGAGTRFRRYRNHPLSVRPMGPKLGK